MQAERWRQIDEIFHLALKVEESRRSAFLDEMCSGDQPLHSELDRLLAHHRDSGGFLESPPFELVAGALARSGSLSQESDSAADGRVGKTVSHYRILSRLGSGGMGVVYEAQDTRLGRRVALKFLAAGLACDPGAVQRFELEARAASSLNHPNVCTIYEVEVHDHQPVIVMELLEGVSLRARIQEGVVPTDELLDIGMQMSAALEAAHARGIVHRDIKPGNIFIVAGGRVKILDFGLAKVMPSPVEGAPSAQNTITLEGVIAGTTSYLSPEQARGEDLDTRSDLFSLGAVIYELATGQHPFARTNTVLTIDAILNCRPPAVTSLNPALPAELDAIVARMLEKDRRLRYQQGSDICADLKRLSAESQPRKSVQGGARSRTVRIRRLALAACLGIAALAVAGLFYLRPSPKLTDQDTLVLADFVNRTGDPVFDGTLRQGLAVELQQSPFLSIVSDDRVRQTLLLMGRPADAPLTPDVVRGICARTGSAAELEGAISRLGNQYVLWLKAQACSTGAVIDEEQVRSPGKEDVLNTLSQIARRFRTRVGEALATVEKHSAPLAEATTPSLEALRAFSAGRKSNASTGSLSFYKRAVEIDPQFATAYAWLGRAYGDIGEPDLAAESTSTAYRLRDRASDAERFFITASYEVVVKGNLDRAQQTCELWAQAYPRDAMPHRMLAGIVYRAAGKYEKSVEEAQKSIELDPDAEIGYRILAGSYQDLDRLGEAGNVLQQAAGRKLEMPQFLFTRYDLAFLKGDQPEMDRAATLGREQPAAQDWLAHHQSLVLAYSGQLQEARKMSKRAADLARQAGHRQRAALFEAAEALREAFFGNAPDARRAAAAALEASRDRDVEYPTAFALALSGDSARAQTLADDLAARFPEDTIARSSELPTLRALLALNHADPARAIELLQIAVPYDLGAPRSNIHGFFGGLYPAYVRGKAYLAMHQGAEAAAEFQKIPDHRGIVFSDPIGAVARLQLARAFVLSGNRDQAKTAYLDFLTLWKGADPGIPVLAEAKAEFARLP